jgi:hypothetical protein
MAFGMRSKESNLLNLSKVTRLILRKLLECNYSMVFNPYSLFESAMDSVVKEKGISRQYIANISPGDRKRSIHDDITILILNLQNQAQ